MVGYETSQKLHAILSWLIEKQGFKNGEQVVVAWAVKGENIPEPLTCEECELPDELIEQEVTTPSQPKLSLGNDIGEAFSNHLSDVLRGYDKKLNPSDEVVILGLDAATSGRLSVTFYRDKLWQDYREKISKWQSDLAWPMLKLVEGSRKKKRVIKVIRACRPLEVALTAYGSKVDAKLKKATIERLMPCIADAAPIPSDLVEQCVRKAASRHSFAISLQWEAALGVACSLYRGACARQTGHKERKYTIVLQEELTSRNYLYGRLLAIIEFVEKKALLINDDKRSSNVERLFFRFADYPASTWLNLVKAVQPYRLRLIQKKHGIWLRQMDKLVDNIVNSFAYEDFVSDKKLTGEFLLGYDCQRRALWGKKTDTENGANILLYNLDLERTVSDYLWGRLLAVGDYIERQALLITDENRPSNAERLFQNFADHPMAAWINILKSIQPYRQRLRQKEKEYLIVSTDDLLDDIMVSFDREEFVSGKKLSGDFLLGYHSQRQKLRSRQYELSEANETTQLDTEYLSRDYLYGRLLAYFEYLERAALDAAGEKRPTNAERLFNIFIDRPAVSTVNLRQAIVPYCQRLQKTSYSDRSAELEQSIDEIIAHLCKVDKLLNDITQRLIPAESGVEQRLSGDFLLGYHAQRHSLRIYDRAKADEAKTITPQH
jgi:hypothetical protein